MELFVGLSALMVSPRHHYLNPDYFKIYVRLDKVKECLLKKLNRENEDLRAELELLKKIWVFLKNMLFLVLTIIKN